jgi:hypothetical protein
MLDSGLKIAAHMLRRFAMPIERPASASKIHRRLSDSANATEHNLAIWDGLSAEVTPAMLKMKFVPGQ